MKKIALLLAVITVIAAFGGCVGKTPDNGKNTRGTADTAADTEEQRKYADYLPDVKYDGYEFLFYSWDIEGWRKYEDIFVEDSGTDPISRNVFNRNSKIEDKYDIVIQYKAEDFNRYFINVQRLTSSGDYYADIDLSMGLSAGLLMRQECFYNLYDVPYLNFDMPWWDHDCVNSLSINGYLPFGSTAVTLIEKAGAYCVFYNLGLANDLSITDNLYQAVINGEWVQDKIKAMGKIASKDMDGDTKISNFDVDRWGIVGNDSGVTALFSGSDCRFVDKDESGELYASFDSAHNIDAIKSFLENILFDTDLYFNGSYTDGANIIDMFTDDRALFLLHTLSSGENLRNMKSDYAILPVPKYNEEQKNYGCAPNVFDNFLTSVPITLNAEGCERSGIILEALAAESLYTVIPAFYEQVLDEKIARDDYSKKMIEIITNSHVWDVGEFYGLGGFPDAFRGITGKSAGTTGIQQTSDIVSFYATYGPTMIADMESLVERAEQLKENAES